MIVAERGGDVAVVGLSLPIFVAGDALEAGFAPDVEASKPNVFFRWPASTQMGAGAFDAGEGDAEVVFVGHQVGGVRGRRSGSCCTLIRCCPSTIGLAKGGDLLRGRSAGGGGGGGRGH